MKETIKKTIQRPVNNMANSTLCAGQYTLHRNIIFIKFNRISLRFVLPKSVEFYKRISSKVLGGLELAIYIKTTHHHIIGWKKYIKV